MQDHGKQRHDPDPAIGLDEILTDWFLVIADFYHFYHQLSTCLGSDVSSQTTISKTGWLGQCPIRQLLNLQDSMRAELEKLNLEMNQTDSQSIVSRCETLMNHAGRLQAINHQAIVLLRLVSLSAS